MLHSGGNAGGVRGRRAASSEFLTVSQGFTVAVHEFCDQLGVSPRHRETILKYAEATHGVAMADESDGEDGEELGS
ncbi:unnamed protein product [Linum trigynum]|uniref:Uncharacterized protein n=1 Tax=Linum trigynum TaxID=586398 RepID=A0AAV2CSK6_9ROSI